MLRTARPDPDVAVERLGLLEGAERQDQVVAVPGESAISPASIVISSQNVIITDSDAGTVGEMTSADLLLHPVRLRIVQAFLADRALTTSELRTELPDVPTASLYRHIAGWSKPGCSPSCPSAEYAAPGTDLRAAIRGSLREPRRPREDDTRPTPAGLPTRSSPD